MGGKPRGKAGKRVVVTSVDGGQEQREQQGGGGWPHLAFTLLLISTCTALWAGHYLYLDYLFENVRFFSHLADFEREMAFRTEMALYFSYYKTLVTAPLLADGLHSIMNDNVTEFGHTINTLQRFNLYPELALAGLYRSFKSIVLRFFDWQQVEQCWRINRGEGMPPVESCIGWGNAHCFYIGSVFILAGTTLPSIFLLGYTLSDSYFGGVIAAAAFIFNHGEATRVMWSPPLRESFAYPIFIAQMLLLTVIIKRNECNRWVFDALTSLTTLFTLCWQFSNFALATQVGALFSLYSLDLVGPALLLTLWKSSVVGPYKRE